MSRHTCACSTSSGRTACSTEARRASGAHVLSFKYCSGRAGDRLQVHLDREPPIMFAANENHWPPALSGAGIRGERPHRRERMSAPGGASSAGWRCAPLQDLSVMNSPTLYQDEDISGPATLRSSGRDRKPVARRTRSHSPGPSFSSIWRSTATKASSPPHHDTEFSTSRSPFFPIPPNDTYKLHFGNGKYFLRAGNDNTHLRRLAHLGAYRSRRHLRDRERPHERRHENRQRM